LKLIFKGENIMRKVTVFVVAVILAMVMAVPAFAAGGLFGGDAFERTVNASFTQNGSKEWKSTGVTFGAAGQTASGSFGGGAANGNTASASLSVAGTSYSESFRERSVSWDGKSTESLTTYVGASTIVNSSSAGPLVGGSFTAGGRAGTFTVQGFSDPSGMTIALAGASGSYQGAGALGTRYNASLAGYSHTQNIKGPGGYNASFSAAGMSVTGRIRTTGGSTPDSQQ
jgi:hypothetical protein